VIRGDKVKVQVSVVRRSYDGPITLELRNLPQRVTTDKVVIPRGRNTAELELAVAPNAQVADRTDVYVQGTATAGFNKEVNSGFFRLSVEEVSFELRVDTPVLKLKPGDRGKVKVSVLRQGYQGPIAVELRRLPVQVKASKEAIPAGQNSGEIDLIVDARADSVERTNVQAVGTSTTGPNLQATSQNFTVIVQASPPVKASIEVRVDPKQVKLAPGGRAQVKVQVTRKNYDGPIAVELSDLPNQVIATKAIIPPGQNNVEIDLMAGPKAPAASKDVRAVARATGAPNVQDTSPAFTVIVQKK
jgi:hypothetical protein